MYQVVIVDDEVHIADGLAKMITHTDARFETVKRFYDSKEAMHWFFEHAKEVDLLVTDICMPGVSGLDLVEQIKQWNSGIQTVILSGFSEFEYAKKAITLGVSAYLLKPVDTDELRQILMQAAEHMEQSGVLTVTRAEEPNDIHAIKEYIQENYQHFSMSALSEKLQMNGDYLARIFKRETNTTIGKYLMDVRMANALDFLDHNDGMKVYEVSTLVGYEDHAFFSKQFKKRFGMTPKEYQKHGRKKIKNVPK